MYPYFGHLGRSRTDGICLYGCPIDIYIRLTHGSDFKDVYCPSRTKFKNFAIASHCAATFSSVTDSVNRFCRVGSDRVQRLYLGGRCDLAEIRPRRRLNDSNEIAMPSRV